MDDIAQIKRALEAHANGKSATWEAEQELEQKDMSDAVRSVVERYGRVWAKDEAYYRAAEALGIKEPPDA